MAWLKLKVEHVGEHVRLVWNGRVVEASPELLATLTPGTEVEFHCVYVPPGRMRVEATRDPLADAIAAAERAQGEMIAKLAPADRERILLPRRVEAHLRSGDRDAAIADLVALGAIAGRDDDPAAGRDLARLMAEAPDEIRRAAGTKLAEVWRGLDALPVRLQWPTYLSLDRWRSDWLHAAATAALPAPVAQVTDAKPWDDRAAFDARVTELARRGDPRAAALNDAARARVAVLDEALRWQRAHLLDPPFTLEQFEDLFRAKLPTALADAWRESLGLEAVPGFEPDVGAFIEPNPTGLDVYANLVPGHDALRPARFYRYFPFAALPGGAPRLALDLAQAAPDGDFPVVRVPYNKAPLPHLPSSAARSIESQS